MEDVQLTDEDLQKLYAWVDEIPLTRPKRNIARDFSDAVLAAEVVYHYFPRLVELHNYSAANSVAQKVYNWNTLNAKVLRRMSFQLTPADMEALSQCKPGAVEKLLYELQLRMAQYRARQRQRRASATSTRSSDSEAQLTLSYTVRLPPPPRSPLAKQLGGDGPYAPRTPDAGAEDLRGVLSLMEQKAARLEQLVQVKDLKIARLQAALAAAEQRLAQLEGGGGDGGGGGGPRRHSRQEPPPGGEDFGDDYGEYGDGAGRYARGGGGGDGGLSAEMEAMQLRQGNGGGSGVGSRRSSGASGARRL